MIREIITKDIPQLFAVRVQTKENRITLDELSELGITEDFLERELNSNIKGWLYEEQDKIKGFAMGNKENGEMMVIALLPEIENKGIGGQLLGKVESWLFENGWNEIWLTTEIDPQLRAYGFYKHRGWVDSRLQAKSRLMVKRIS